MSKTTLKRFDGTIIAEGDATIAELAETDEPEIG